MKTQICENINTNLERILPNCAVHYHDLSINEKRGFLMKGRDHVQILKTLIRNYKRTKPIYEIVFCLIDPPIFPVQTTYYQIFQKYAMLTW